MAFVRWEISHQLDYVPAQLRSFIAERAMRPIAIGRKNWLFVGSEQASHRAAILTSLVASYKNNFVEPCAYLKNVPTKLPHKPNNEQLHQLLGDLL